MSSSYFRKSLKTETFELDIACINFSNNSSYEKVSPAANRLHALIRDINVMDPPPDIFCVLGTGPSSLGRAWVQMAAEIETKTGLRLECTKRTTLSDDSDGKSIFFNPRRVMVEQVEQLWASTEWRENDVVIVHARPVVEETTIISDRLIKVGFVNFSNDVCANLLTANWINSNKHRASIFMGDFKTFGHKSGKDVIQLICDNNHLIDRVPATTFYTFRSLMGKFVSLENDKLEDIGPCSYIAERGPIFSKVRLFETVDHIFTRPGIQYVGKVHPMSDASDHSILSLSVTI